MKRSHLAAAVIGVSVTAILSSDASAYYHPTLGRWMQRDQIGYPEAMNLYQYAVGKAVTGVDPYGLFITIVPPSGGRGNPFHYSYGPTSLRGRFASRAEYRKQLLKAASKPMEFEGPDSPAVMRMATDFTAHVIATAGYEAYLRAAADVQRYGQAVALCMELQHKDAMGEINDKAFTAYQGIGGLPKEDGTTTPVTITGIYHVTLHSSDGTCYASAFHDELEWHPWYDLWNSIIVAKEDLRTGDCPLNTRNCNCERN